MLEGCQNPNGCRKIAVNEVEVRNVLGDVIDERELCAYCTSNIEEQVEADPDKSGWEVEVVG